ncbi:hypothetical protein HOY82DRAFT_563370 [Tuber indicum]|nr:hypothetical protein HOY82DRAFT_563370 [Tuber indicum]
MLCITWNIISNICSFTVLPVLTGALSWASMFFRLMEGKPLRHFVIFSAFRFSSTSCLVMYHGFSLMAPMAPPFMSGSG